MTRCIGVSSIWRLKLAYILPGAIALLMIACINEGSTTTTLCTFISIGLRTAADDKEVNTKNQISPKVLQPSTRTDDVLLAQNHTSFQQQAPLTTEEVQAPCHWSANSVSSIWGDNGGPFSRATTTTNVAREHVTFAGRSILVLGGSTSNDLAGDFMQMVLRPEQQAEVSEAWRQSGVEGQQLFPPAGKKEKTFDRRYKSECMEPLSKAGWKFTPLNGTSAGCIDCVSRYTNIDYVAELRGGAQHSSDGISYEFSWKPEIFTSKADVTAFRERYCHRRYDAVHIGRGLHDVVWFPNITQSEMRAGFLKLATLVDCFPKSTLIVLRTPYWTGRNPPHEENAVGNVTSVIKDLVSKGAFGATRSVMIDGHLLTASSTSPRPYDGHHFNSTVGRTYWRMFGYVAREFFGSGSVSQFHHGDVPRSNLQECGIQIANNASATVSR